MPTIHSLIANPNAYKLEFKEKFIERYKILTDWETFKKYSLSYRKKSVRINTLKIKIPKLKAEMIRWTFEQIPWCKEVF